jgi:hypothetical protein
MCISDALQPFAVTVHLSTLFHVLVTRHGVWIDNWIYWTLIVCNYKQLQHFHWYTHSTDNYKHTKSSQFAASSQDAAW